MFVNLSTLTYNRFIETIVSAEVKLMSYKVDFDEIIKRLTKELDWLNKKYKNKADYSYRIMKLITSIYLVVVDEDTKNNFIDSLINLIKLKCNFDDVSKFELFSYILNQNIIAKDIESNDLVISRWMVFKSFIKRREYQLISEENGYVYKLIKDDPSIRY